MTYREEYYLEKIELNLTNCAMHEICIYGMGAIGRALLRKITNGSRQKKLYQVDSTFKSQAGVDFKKCRQWLYNTDQRLTVAVTPINGHLDIMRDLQTNTSHQVVGYKIIECESLVENGNLSFEEGENFLLKLALHFPDEPDLWEKIIKRETGENKAVYQKIKKIVEKCTIF